MATKSKLGEMLVKEKLLTETQLKTAMEFQGSVGGTIGVILVKLNFIADDKLTQFIAKKQGLAIADLDKMFLADNLIKRVPRKLIEELQVVPIAFKDGVLTIASSDPTDLNALDKIAFATGHKVEMQLASRSAVTRALSNAFQVEEKPKGGGPMSKQDLLNDLTGGHGAPKAAPKAALVEELPKLDLNKALIPLLIEKGIITEAELRRKAQAL